MDSPTGSVKSVKLSALDRLRAKTKHIPKIDGPTAEEQRAEAAKKKKASFNFDWSWRAFVGNKSTTDPDSPYYVPPPPPKSDDEEEEVKPSLALAAALNRDHSDSDGMSTARSGSSHVTSLMWGGRKTARSALSARSRFTSKSMLKKMATATVPWGYASHLKRMYFRRKGAEAAAAPKPERKMMLPSEARALKKDASLPRYMRFHAATKSLVKLPSFITGVKAADAVLEPRKAESSGSEPEDAKDLSPRRREWLRRQRARDRLRANEDAFSNKSKHKAGRQNDVRKLNKKSVQQLRHQRATNSDAYTVLADKESPLAARRFREMEEERRTARKVRRATTHATKKGNTLLKADNFLTGMHKSRTMGMRAYLRERKSEADAVARVEMAKAIQRSWKGYKARMMWEYVKSLPRHVAQALLHTAEETGQSIGLGVDARRRQLKSRGSTDVGPTAPLPLAAVATVGSIASMAEADAPLTLHTQHGEVVVPLSGGEFMVSRTALDDLREAANKACMDRFKASRSTMRRKHK